MKLFSIFVLFIASIAGSQALAEYKPWSEKYSPFQYAEYTCSTQDFVGNEETFILSFDSLDYLGSAGGYFYNEVSVRQQNSEEKVSLLSRPVGTEGVYVFKNGFNIKLTSENDLDGSFENNMSEILSVSVGRGGGKCFLSYHTEAKGL